jgi:hypothetical protein
LKTKFTPLLFLALLLSTFAVAQKAIVRGIITDENSFPIPGVNVTNGNEGTMTNLEGYYQIKIAPNEEVTLKFSHISSKNVTATFNLEPYQDYKFSPIMKPNIEQITTVVISGKENKKYTHSK